jgi:hypothetical protein
MMDLKRKRRVAPKTCILFHKLLKEGRCICSINEDHYYWYFHSSFALGVHDYPLNLGNSGMIDKTDR